MPTILLKRGTTGPGTSLQVGEPAFRIDTGQLYIGRGVGNEPVHVPTSWFYDSDNTILIAQTARNPQPISVQENCILGRATGGSLGALTATQVWDILNGANPSSGILNLAGARLTGLADPIQATDAVNKNYVDTMYTTGLVAHAVVIAMNMSEPPGNPNPGDRYWVPPGASGAWQGHDYEIATWDGSQWQFEPVDHGDFAFVLTEGAFYWYNANSFQSDRREMLAVIPLQHGWAHHAGGYDELDVSLLADEQNALLIHAFTAKGQILVGTGEGTYTALAPGADGQVLVADSSQPAGVRWETFTGGVSSFLGLQDTPNSYSGHAGKVVAVATGEDGLVFVPFGTYLENTPTSGETNRAPTSAWAYSHAQASGGVHGVPQGETILHSGSVIDGGTL
ncbi:MAG: DUF2793 domain-containing protein [Nanopusillaceae archaeon]